MNEDQCLRLRNEKGEHKLSILPCGYNPETGKIDCYDLAIPDGKVQYCGVPVGLVEELIDHLGLESIQ